MSARFDLEPTSNEIRVWLPTTKMQAGKPARILLISTDGRKQCLTRFGWRAEPEEILIESVGRVGGEIFLTIPPYRDRHKELRRTQPLTVEIRQDGLAETFLCQPIGGKSRLSHVTGNYGKWVAIAGSGLLLLLIGGVIVFWPRESRNISITSTAPVISDRPPPPPPPQACLSPADGTGEAVKDPQVPGGYRRVLSLPGARLYDHPAGEAPERPIDVFSALYLFDCRHVDGKSWLQVGESPRKAPTGWVEETATEIWKHALVLKFTPRSAARESAMFFDSPDKVQELLDPIAGPRQAGNLLKTWRAEGKAPGVKWVEPQESYRTPDKLYLLPILEARLYQPRGGQARIIAKVASVTMEPAGGAQPQAVALKDAKVGIVFVVDATLSMEKYIKEVQKIVGSFCDQFAEEGLLDKTAFGLVGFRGDTHAKPKLEYWTNTFHQPKLGRDCAGLKADAAAMHEAKVSTPGGWKEDVYAGLDEAIENKNWDKFDARFVILITDAGPLTAKSGHVLHPELDTATVRDNAKRKKIAIYPLHLITKELENKPEEDAYAETEYKQLGLSGDEITQKYSRIKAQSTDQLATGLQAFLTSFLAVNRDFWGKDQLISPADIQEKAGMEKLVFSELFRAQFEYLAKGGAGVPRYTAEWTTDVDLVNPPILTMEPEILLTKNQLNGLAQSVDQVLLATKTSTLKQRSFLSMLQNIAAGIAYDPARRTAGVFEDLAGNGQLDAYLKALPYHSEVLDMTGDALGQGGQAEHAELLDSLENKLRLYRRTDSDQGEWTVLPGSDAKSDSLTRLDLDKLP